MDKEKLSEISDHVVFFDANAKYINPGDFILLKTKSWGHRFFVATRVSHGRVYGVWFNEPVQCEEELDMSEVFQYHKIGCVDEGFMKSASIAQNPRTP